MASAKLKKAANTTLKDYMGLYEDEQLLILADEDKSEIGQALFEAGKSLCEEAFYIEMKTRENDGDEPPEIVAEMMKLVDVIVIATSKSLTHTNARKNASSLGVRIGTMPGIKEDTLIRCLAADFEKVSSLTDKVSDLINESSTIRVETKAGTNLIIPMKDRMVFHSSGILRNIGDCGNLPSGEVFFAPWEGKTNGIVVIDASIGCGIGKVKNPITIEIENGMVKKIDGAGVETQNLITLLKRSNEDGKAIGKFGIGTNYKAEICGEILEDEKAIGGCTIAFGNNLALGGIINSAMQIPCIISKPSIWCDDEMIMSNGKFVFDI